MRDGGGGEMRTGADGRNRGNTHGVCRGVGRRRARDGRQREERGRERGPRDLGLHRGRAVAAAAGRGRCAAAGRGGDVEVARDGRLAREEVVEHRREGEAEAHAVRQRVRVRGGGRGQGGRGCVGGRGHGGGEGGGRGGGDDGAGRDVGDEGLARGRRGGGQEGLVVGKGVVLRGLLEHARDDLLDALGPEAELASEDEVLAGHAGLVVLVVRVAGPAGAREEGCDVLAVGGRLCVLVVALGALAVGVVRGGGAAGAVCHGELGAGLCEAGAGVDPEEMVEDEGPCGLFARGDGVQVVRVLVRGRAEGGALRRGRGRVGVVQGVCMGLIRCRCRCRWLCLAVRLGVRLGVGVGGGAGMGGGCDGWLSTGAVGGDGEGRAWALCGAKDDGDGDVAGVCLICHRDVADENKVEASSPLPGAAPSSAPAALPLRASDPVHTHTRPASFIFLIYRFTPRCTINTTSGKYLREATTLQHTIQLRPHETSAES